MSRFGERLIQGLRRRPITIALACVAATTVAGAAGLPALSRGFVSATGQEAPTIEPRYTRLFAGDASVGRQPAVSPDGRWIVFPDQGNLWAVSVDGGAPTRLTRGDFRDDHPVWFPDGRRIAFRSTRPSGPGESTGYIATLSFDPRSGQASGLPRQVGLGIALDAPCDVSPDGQWIAYSARRDGKRVLEVIPAAGGTARTIAEPDGRSWPTWSPDGRSLYYVARRGSSADVMHVPAEGGTSRLVSTWPSMVSVGPDAKHVFRPVPQGSRDDWIIEVATIEGDPLARVKLPRGMVPVRFADDSRGFTAVTSGNAAEHLKVVPIGGGPGRHLNEGSNSNWPYGWTPDGEHILLQTELNGEDMLSFASASGGLIRQVKIPDLQLGRASPVLSADGRHVLYAVQEDELDEPTLKVFSTESGRSRVLARADLPFRLSAARGVARGAGGTLNRDGENFLYFENAGDQRQLRASPPEGPSRVLWAFPAAEEPPPVAVHGDRIAFVEESDAGSTLVIATAGETASRRGHSLEVVRPVWSPDGTRIAAAYWVPPDFKEADILVVEVTVEGELVGEPRILDASAKWWSHLQWLPDGSGVVVVGQRSEAVTGSNVWLVSLEPGANPVALTQDEPGQVWDFVLSPDGRHIAYAAEISISTPSGASIWRVGLEDILNGGAQ